MYCARRALPPACALCVSPTGRVAAVSRFTAVAAPPLGAVLVARKCSEPADAEPAATPPSHTPDMPPYLHPHPFPHPRALPLLDSSACCRVNSNRFIGSKSTPLCVHVSVFMSTLTRQVRRSVESCRARGITWLFHIDDDELLYFHESFSQIVAEMPREVRGTSRDEGRVRCSQGRRVDKGVPRWGETRASQESLHTAPTAPKGLKAPCPSEALFVPGRHDVSGVCFTSMYSSARIAIRWCHGSPASAMHASKESLMPCKTRPVCLASRRI